MKAASIGRKPRVMFFVAKRTISGLLVLDEMLETGTVKPLVERTYAFDEIADAMRSLGEGHARSKIVVSV